MYHTIVVPLDGSAFGEHALPLALSLARRANATLEIVHVHVPLADLYAETIANVESGLDTGRRQQEQAYLDKTAQRLIGLSGAPVKARLLEGPVAGALQEYLSACGADLVVMTTHGRGALSRWWLGSVADELIRRVPVPLVAIRPHEKEPDFSREPEPRHVLIPLDGSPLAEHVLPAATELGGPTRTEYTLLRVVQPFAVTAFDAAGLGAGTVVPEALARLRQEAVDYLDRVARRLRQQGLWVETVVAVHDQPAVAILDAVRERPCDLVAVATHGRHGLARLMLGSVADKVVRAAPVPVLVYRPVAP
jgi:nucleotide-binding universal stress UspA family protein